MKVGIKSFDVAMEVKNSGVEFAIYSPDGKVFHGDLVLSKTQLKWFKGKSTTNPKTISLPDLIKYMEGLP